MPGWTRARRIQYAFQAGVGAEALNRNVELRANGYIPFSNQADRYASGWTNAYLINNQLILDGWHRYVVSLGGVNLEAGLPVARWNQDSLWLYASYYYLDGDYVSGSSGVRGRAEVRIGSQLALGATIAYDDIFQIQATGYLRYGSKSLAGHAKDAIDTAERNFLALRGLPMQRETDMRMVSAQQNLPGSVATNPGNGGAAWVVRCTGATTNTGSATVNCANASLDAMLAQAGTNDVLLVGGGAASNLATLPLENGRPTLRLAAGTQLSVSGNAPTLASQFGAVNLSPIFGASVGAAPSFSNGVISIGSNTTINGLSFTNVSITNYSTSNVVIAGNTFTGSYSDNPTALATAQAFGTINISANALPAIQLENVDNLAITGNTFNWPQVQTYVSQTGQDGNFVCNQQGNNPTGLCLSGNAVRLNSSTNTSIINNTVVGALDEAFRINNPIGNLLISNNTISQMRMGPDSNIGSAIIVGQNAGTSNVEIINNNFSDNSIGVYPTVAAANGSVTRAGGTPKNVIDPIEIGLCRGTVSYPRTQDLYASADFSGNCSNTTTMNLRIAGNQINLPAITGGRQDGDGIDLNIGANAVLRATIENNTIFTLGQPRTRNIADNGLTFDIRGNSDIVMNILNNFVQNAGDAAIGFSFQNTPFLNQPGSTQITISGNTFGNGVTTTVEADLVSNAGVPVSNFYVYGSGDNELLNDNVKQQPFNAGPYPNLFVNDIQLDGRP